MYDGDLGEFMVVLIIRKQRWRRPVWSRKMGVKLTRVWGAKLKVSLLYSCHPVGLFVAVDSRRYVYLHVQMWTATFVWYHLMVCRMGDEKSG